MICFLEALSSILFLVSEVSQKVNDLIASAIKITVISSFNFAQCFLQLYILIVTITFCNIYLILKCSPTLSYLLVFHMSVHYQGIYLFDSKLHCWGQVFVILIFEPLVLAKI